MKLQGKIFLAVFIPVGVALGALAFVVGASSRDSALEDARA